MWYNGNSVSFSKSVYSQPPRRGGGASEGVYSLKHKYTACPRRILTLLVTLTGVITTGCVTEYDRDDIAEYVRGLGVDGVVSDSYAVVEDKKGYDDRYWTVTLDNGLTFHVIDDYGWGMESVSNYLRDDYSESALAFIADSLPEFEYLRFVIESGDEYSAHVVASYTTPDELKACRNELAALRVAFTDLGFDGLSVRYTLEYMHPLRNVTDYVIDDADIFGSTDSEKSWDEMLAEYITTILDYRYDTSLVTEEQIDAALADYEMRVGIYRGNAVDRELYEPEKIEYYDDIIANKYYYGISFGSLYEILRREGFDVSGDAWHYSFTGADGSVYEISYDFIDSLYTDYDYTPRDGYYYLRDGEVQTMGAYFYNHFTVREIEELTGLKLVDSIVE